MAFGDLGFDGISTILTAEVEDSGTFYVDVSNNFSTLGAAYTLSAFVDDFAGDTTTTGVLEIGGTATGTIEIAEDSDWFAIELTAGDFTRITSDLFDGDLILRDELGNFVTFGNPDFDT